MATLPVTSDGLTADVVDVIEPSKTYSLDYYNDYQINGFTDELAAIKQAIFKILNTERYKFIIYSWNYGIELVDLIGQPIPYVYAELQRRIEEALLQDDRITAVYNFSFSNTGGDVAATFDVDTIFGTVTGLTKEVAGIV